MKIFRIAIIGLSISCIVLIISAVSCKDSATPLPHVMPSILSFIATPTQIILESSSTLSWDVSDAERVEIDQGIGQVAPTGAKDVTPAFTTTYTLTAYNGSFVASSTCQVAVDWQNYVCYKTATGTKYHRENCQYLSQSKIQTTLGEACQEGLTPCSACSPPSCR